MAKKLTKIKLPGVFPPESTIDPEAFFKEMGKFRVEEHFTETRKFYWPSPTVSKCVAGEEAEAYNQVLARQARIIECFRIFSHIHSYLG
jgi:hypothetical protein